MTRYLLDANVLIAAIFEDHEHHRRADGWLAHADSFAVCPMVEGALARFALRIGESGACTAAIIAEVRNNPRCDFWPDDLSYADVDLVALRGHRQVTDAYLVALAQRQQAHLATFDQALAGAHPDVVTIVP